MKKIVLVVAAATGALLASRRMQAQKAEQALWAEATDSVVAASRDRA